MLARDLLRGGPDVGGRAASGRRAIASRMKVMNLEYEDGVLRVENAEGLRWELANVEKPRLTFDYDALYVSDERAVRRARTHIHPLLEAEIEQVKALIGQLAPPPWANFQNQTIVDLRAFARGLVGSVVKQLEYDGLLDVMITGRVDSTDLYADEARRVLSYVDSVWNAFYGLAAQIKMSARADLKTAKEYANMMPFPPPIEYFSSGLHPGLFDAPRDHH
jgi:hypothetical protein